MPAHFKSIWNMVDQVCSFNSERGIMKLIIKQIWINKRYILKNSWQIAGSIYAVIGLAGMLADLDGLIFPCLDTWKRVLIGIAILFGVWALVLAGCCIFCPTPGKICALRLSNNRCVYVQFGDLFAETVICDKSGTPSAGKRNIIIPVNCCFDTIVDDDLISSQKIHGKAFRILYDSKKYTPESLSKVIRDNLHSRHIPFTYLTEQQKRKGNLERYPFGTIAELPVDDTKTFFLLALTEFSSDLHAEIHNRENYLAALQRMIEYISSRSQGFPTVLPLIGGGLPEVSEREQTILELLLKVLELNKDKINCDIHIVIRENGRDDISILELKQ